MFGGSRRHRPPVQPLTRETANPNAATAAASAFMRGEPSISLSSAAAAAALRARPTTPTNVAEVQSKRALRRSGSVSSRNSQDRSHNGKQLQRSPSVGSMTERTFRSPSPGRSPAPIPQDAPPVPALPKASPQKQSFRNAHQRVKDGSLSVRTSDLQQASADASDARPGSISPSINFSYPRASIESPSQSTASGAEVTMVYDPNSRRMVPRVEVLEKQHVRRASEKPAKKKKQASQPVNGAAEGARALVTQPTSRDSTRQIIETSPPPSKTQEAAVTETSPPPDKSAQPMEVEPHRTPVVELDRNNAEPRRNDGDISDTATVTPAPEAPRSFPLKSKKSPSKTVGEAGSSKTLEHGDAPEKEKTATISPSVTQIPTASAEEGAHAQEPGVATIADIRGQAREVRRTRVESQSPSHSPARSAHFAPTTAQLLVRHEPPPRSISPRKSALKYSNSVRGGGPSDDSSEASGSVSGQYSRDSSVQATKKAFRVSFTDENTVVDGEPAEPPELDSSNVPSPQVKKPWHNVITRYQKKDKPLVDEDETMSPRPALPSFGSVRDKKPREPDNERPLVRPSEKPWTPVSGPEISRTSSDSPVTPLSAQENASRNAANISKAREPLPPVVQSVDIIGYLSNSSSSSDDELDEFDDSDTARSTQLTEQHHDVQPKEEFTQPPGSETPPEESSSLTAPEPKSLDGNGYPRDVLLVPKQEDTRRPEDVPMISITNPSPLLKEVEESSPASDYFDVPGGFPEDSPSNSAAVAKETPSLEMNTQAAQAPALAEIEEAPVPSSPMEDIKEEEDESTDGSSIYSDAYEDLSDIEGDGFMSLDAVLEAPTSGAMAKIYEKALSQVKENATTAVSVPGSEIPELTPKTSQDWENAKVYWRSLSSDKRRQLETEAMEEAAEEADQEEPPKTKKPKKKRRSADKRALATGTTEGAHIDNGEGVAQGSRKSTKGSHRDDVLVKPFRKSMRGNQSQGAVEPQQPSGAMRKTLRGNATVGDAHISRPLSYHQGSTAESSINSKRSPIPNGRPASSGGLVSASAKPTLRRRGSDSSESSFKRSRPSLGEGFGFRRSMRSPVREAEPQHSSKGSGRFSLRSLSPPGSPFRRSSFTAPSSASNGGIGMRQSLRSDATDTKHKRFSSFGRSSGKKGKKGKLGSRFADSSDEEDAGPSTFRSRFADSSDEDERPMSAVKEHGLSQAKASQGASYAAAAALGVRPAQARSDSPDLPDSDDEIIQPKRGSTLNGNTRPPIPRNRSGRGELVSSAGVVKTEGVGDRPSHSRRGSFMSSILRRKKSPGNKITREINESAARRDTRLERSTEELVMIRSNSANYSQAQKRDPEWPLANGSEATPPARSKSAVEASGSRPATSSGPGPSTSSRGFLKRRSLSHQDAPPYVPPHGQEEETPSEIMGKKKKFGALRKMFGLND